MGLILMGALRMPLPDDPAELGVVEWVQIKSVMREAADEIERLRVQISALKTPISQRESKEE